MSTFWADPANPPDANKIHPALTSFADERAASFSS
jgi:hypothetical protein